MSTPGYEANEYGELVGGTSAYNGAAVGLMPPEGGPTPVKDRRRYNRRERLLVIIVSSVVGLLFVGLGAYFWTDGSQQLATENRNATAAAAPTPTIAPTATAVPPPTVDPVATSYTTAANAINSGINLDNLNTAITSLLPVVKVNPSYKSNAAIYLFWAYVQFGELESQNVTKLDEAATQFNKAIQVGNDNKIALTAQFSDPNNGGLNRPASTWLRTVSSFDDWMKRVQDEADWAKNYAAGADANTKNNLDDAISNYLKVYSTNKEYLHDSAGDKWIAALLYDAYSRKADNTADKSGKCNALNSAKVIAGENVGLSSQVPLIQGKIADAGCSS